MATGDVGTSCDGGRWHNHVEGQARLPGEFYTRHDAVTAGTAEATRRGVSHVVQNRDGTILRIVT